MVSVGFPLGTLSRWFLGSHSSWEVFVRHGPVAGRPCLVIMGDRDDFTGIETISGLVSEAEAEHRGAAAAANRSADGTLPLRLEVVRGGDHFFHGRGLQTVASLAVSWLKETMHTVTR